MKLWTRSNGVVAMHLGALLALGGCTAVSDFGEYDFTKDAGSAGSGGSGGASGSGGQDSGAGGSSGSGGDSGAGGSGGSSGTGGSGGDAGMDGGAGSGGPMDAGMDAGDGGPQCGAVEICDDGVDLDGSGTDNCPELESVFPEARQATAAADVHLRLKAPGAGWSVECRSGKPSEIGCMPFEPCGKREGDSHVVSPHSADQSQDPSFDGLMQTQVRFVADQGEESKVVARTYYVHHSLHGVAHCTPKASDTAYFEHAKEVLVPNSDVAKFDPGDVRLANPFVHVEFEPQVDGTYSVRDSDGTWSALSLRRRFVLDPTRRMLLITRVYDGRRTSTCRAWTIRTHASDEGVPDNFDQYRNHRDVCDAIVLNKRGAGACLVGEPSTNSVSFSKKSSGCRESIGSVPTTVACALRPSAFVERYFVGADNFMWRKMMQTHNDGSSRMFSDKCFTTASCADAETLYLPDHDLLVP